MPNKPSISPGTRLTLAGAGFGLYFTAGLAYFEVFRHSSHWQAVHYLGVALILVTLSVVMAHGLFGPMQWRGRPLRTWERWFLLPLVGYLVADGGLYLYAGLVDAANFRTDQVLPGILTTTALLGILPVQAALVLAPQRRQTMVPQTSDRPSYPEPEPYAVKDDLADTAPSLLTIEASHGEPMFQILRADLLLVEAADNYCKFHYLVDGQHKMKMLRLTLREAEEALQGDPGFHRCHRSFIVNGAKVVEVQGNSQAYRLRLEAMEEPIPVSRTFNVDALRPKRQ